MTFVLLSPRSGAEVLAAEYADFLSYSGLTPAELEQRPLDNPGADLGSFDGVEGVFIGGSPFTITRPVDVEWQEAISQKLVDFIQVESERQRFGIFSTCYGTSMLAHYLDGEVNSQYSESAGTSEVSLTDAGRVDPITAALPDRFTALTGHKDSVVRVPEEATLLATGETCPVQIYRYRENVWTSQFHPEMDAAGITRRLSFYEDEGYCDPAEIVETYARFEGQDTAAANSLLRRFVEYSRSALGMVG